MANPQPQLGSSSILLGMLRGLAQAKQDATAVRGGARRPSPPLISGQLAEQLGLPMDAVQVAPTWDELLYAASARQRDEWMARQGITGDGLAMHGNYYTRQQRAVMYPRFPLKVR